MVRKIYFELLNYFKIKLKLSKLILLLTKLNIKLYDKLLWPISATFVITSLMRSYSNVAK